MNSTNNHNDQLSYGIVVVTIKKHVNLKLGDAGNQTYSRYGILQA